MGQVYHLQNRWRLSSQELLYYGLRNRDRLFHNRIRLTKAQAEILRSLPRELTDDEKKALFPRLSEQVVTEADLRTVPASLQEARFCACCCANDFIIPGLEFDENGLCPICQTAEETKDLKSLVPLIHDIPRSKKSRFDVAVFYTGGKDSTYLLYHLAKANNLRVLALTWEIPFISESAKASIENAKKVFPTVEFIVRTVSEDVLRKIYRKLFQLSGNTCACPSLAYVLFYPELVENKVPYFVVGNEPAQILGLYYNHMAPKLAYSFPDNRFLQILINIGRVMTLHPPFKPGQFHTHMTMKQLAYGDSVFKKLSGYRNELVSNVVAAIHEEPLMVAPLRRAIRRASWTGNIPAFMQIDFDEICGGRYDWKKVKHILKEECGWQEPVDTGKGLHTSCDIEKCKEYTQFQRFYHCQSQMIPFSALEMSLATRNRNLTREQAIAEIRNSLGFCLDEIPEYRHMCSYLEREK